MNDEPRQKLRELIVEYGHSLCGDPRRCESLLKDYCGNHRREIFVLVAALKHKVTDDLLKISACVPPEIVICRLRKRLQDELAMTTDAAHWAVESWALALGFIPSPLPAVKSAVQSNQPPAAPKLVQFETTHPSAENLMVGHYKDDGVVTLASAGQNALCGSDLSYALEITLEEAYKGKDTKVHIPSWDNCDACHGRGTKHDIPDKACGTGKVAPEPCIECHGRGKIKKQKTLDVRIPSGIDDGMRIRSAGNGEPGSNGGGPGDLFIDISLKKHNVFRRDGDDLHCSVPISNVTATMGGEINVPTLIGIAAIDIQAGTKTGKKLRLKGFGIQNVRTGVLGDLYCHIVVKPTVDVVEASVKLPQIVPSMVQHVTSEAAISAHQPKAECLIAGRYRDNGDGTVTDVTTSLQWMRFSLGQEWKGGACFGEARTYTQQEAMEAAISLNRTAGYAHHRDWRLPTTKELLSLVYCSSGVPKTWNDTGKPCEGAYDKPTINQQAFPNTPMLSFWPSRQGIWGDGWYVHFSVGYAGFDHNDGGGRVRLVRSV